MRNTLFILCLFSFLAAVGQPYASNKGWFQVDQKEGCAPFTVNITIIPPFECDSDDPCDMDFEGNNQFQSLTFTHTYTQPGTYQLVILFQTSGTDEITITVNPNSPPIFDLYTCAGNGVQLKVTDTDYDQYVINYNDGTGDLVKPSGSFATDIHTFVAPGLQNISVRGRNLNASDNCVTATQPFQAVAGLSPPVINQLTVVDDNNIRLDFTTSQHVLYKLEIGTRTSVAFQFIQDVHNISTVVVTNLNNQSNFYCFRLGAYDPCNGTIVYSNVVCSALLDVEAANEVNRVRWQTSPLGVTDFTLSATPNPPVIFPPGASAYDDVDIICGSDYCYQLTSQYPGGVTSISLQKCVTATSTTTPSPVQNISAVVFGDEVQLSWQQDPAFTAAEYSILKTVDGESSIAGTATTPTFTDADFNASPDICYTIQYADVCGNTSPFSGSSCPVFLSADLKKDNTITLAWTPYRGWVTDVDHYILEVYDINGSLIASVDTGTALGWSLVNDDQVNQVYYFRVIAIPADPTLPNSISNQIQVIKNANIFYPTAFTPNGDGLNDVFLVFGQFTSSADLKIFNRWGEMVFTSKTLSQGWDGTYKGSSLPEGTYVFTAKMIDFAGRDLERSGTFVLLKKR